MPGEPEFPAALLREQSVAWNIVSSTFAPGQVGDGSFPVGRLDGGGLWMGTLSNVSLHTRAHILQWREIAALAEGGSVPIIVPMCEVEHAPVPHLPHSDETLFGNGAGDDVGYYVENFEATVSAIAAVRATTLLISTEFYAAPEPGMRFSIEHAAQGHRLYEIKTVVDAGDGDYTLTIRPPLRQAVTVGMELEFRQPKCVVRLASPDAMDLDLEFRRWARPSVSFIEHIYPV